MSNIRALLGSVIAAGLALTGCSGTGTSVRAAVKPESERKQAPNFSLKDANGTPVRLSDYRGKVVLLNFWATWCGPCKLEIPWFMDFEQRYKDRGFAVLGVSMDEDGWEAVKPYIADRKVNYRVVLGDDLVGNLYGGIDSLPTTFLIDRDGRVASVHVGLVAKNDYEGEIGKLMEMKATALRPAMAERASR